MIVDRTDIAKIADALEAALVFHVHRDRMNAAVHKAHEVRWSPLTSTLMSERDRIHRILTHAPVELPERPHVPDVDTDDGRARLEGYLDQSTRDLFEDVEEAVDEERRGQTADRYAVPCSPAEGPDHG